jgi:hypothetical protein
MDEQTQKDIRSLLKTFGIQADETIQAYLAKYPHVEVLNLRITLKDLTDYGSSGSDEELALEIEGQVRR